MMPPLATKASRFPPLLRRQLLLARRPSAVQLQQPSQWARRNLADGPTTATNTSTDPESLLGRRYPLLPDLISPTNAHLLTLTLAPYLTPTQPPPTTIRTKGELHPGYYLAYFPPLFLHEQDVMPDGSDATQSPGPGGEWPRRMWAGGSVTFMAGLRLGATAVCEEEVVKVERKGGRGVVGGEKVFVWFERRYLSGRMSLAEVYRGIRGEARGELAVMERRCLVFMKHEEAPSEPATKKEQRIVKPRHPPDFTLSFIPTPTLLLRFSALTFNAHKIHYDPVFSTAVEHHRAPLCHGPLSQVLLLELLRLNLPQGPRREKIYDVRQFDYKNLAPMYVGEKYTICGRLKSEEAGGRVYELWAETPEGGLSVKAEARLERVA